MSDASLPHCDICGQPEYACTCEGERKGMTTAEILDMLREYYPEVLTADGLEDAIVGLAEGWFADHSHHEVVCYDYAKCVEIMVSRGLTNEEAEEWLSFNTLGAFMGDRTPVFLHRWRDGNQ